MARKELVIAIRAVDLISRPIRATMGSITKLGRRAITTTARVLRKMGGLAKSLLSIKNVIAGLALALAGGAIARALAGVSAEIDRTAKSARALGIAVEEYSKLEFVADRAGISTQQLATAFRTAQRNVAQFVRGEGGQAARAFRDIDVNLTDANGQIKEGTDLLRAILVPLSKIPDEAVRTQKLVDIFGRAGAEMKNLGTDLDGVLADAERFGFVTENQARIAEQFQDAMANLRRGWLVFKANVLEAIGPVLEDLVNDSAESLGRFGKLVGDFLLTVRAAFGDGKLASQARLALLQIYDNIIKTGQVLIDSGARVLGVTIFAGIRAAVAGTGKMVQTELGKELTRGFAGLLADLDGMWNKLGRAGDLLFPLQRRVVSEAREIADSLVVMSDLSSATISDVAGTVAARVSDVMPAVNREFARTKQQILALALEFDKTGILVKSIGTTMRQLGVDTKQGGDKTAASLYGVREAIEDVRLGMRLMADDLPEISLQFIQLGRDIYNTVGNQISDGLTSLATGASNAKDAFRDMAKGILDDLTRLIIRMAVFNALNSVFGTPSSSNNEFRAGFDGVGRLPIGSAGPLPIRTGGFVHAGGVRRFAFGGVVPGPNINRDMVPALPAPGEGVVNRRGMQAIGESRLHAINRGEGGGDINLTIHVSGGGQGQANARAVAEAVKGVMLDLVSRNPAFRSQLRDALV